MDRIRAARIGVKGSLIAIEMLEEDMRHLESVFPKAGEKELRIHHRDTVLEYEESMRVWEEMKDTGELCTSDTDSEEEDELTGEELLRALDKAAAAADPARAPKAESMGIDWPKRVLRQTILVSSIAAEILTDPGRADWDESCYEECRKLLVQETTRMGDITEDRGTEEIPVLVDWEVQHWVAEALEGAKQASSLVGDQDRCTACRLRRGRRSGQAGQPQSGSQEGQAGCPRCRQGGSYQPLAAREAGEAGLGEDDLSQG
jgi:hypothetical protein